MKPLEQRVAELFSPKPWKHTDATKLSGFKCDKCGELQYSIDDNYLPSETCPIPDPVDITKLGSALECYRDNLPDDVGVRILIRFKVYCKAKGLDYEKEKHDGDAEAFRWMLYEATAEQIWEMNCLTKEKEVT